MKKLLPIMVLIAVLVTGFVLYQGSSLKTQLLTADDQNQVEPVVVKTSDCEKMSEASANDCFFRLAIQEEDDTYCGSITKSAEKQKCEREVELQP